jgi:Transmembrane Fragile-X-F protein
MSKSSNTSSGGISFFGLLGIVFIVLKLCKVIDWSWWYVTMPLWIGLALVIIGFIFFIIYKAIKDR